VKVPAARSIVPLLLSAVKPARPAEPLVSMYPALVKAPVPVRVKVLRLIRPVWVRVSTPTSELLPARFRIPVPVLANVSVPAPRSSAAGEVERPGVGQHGIAKIDT
jgi:hypothetical protein